MSGQNDEEAGGLAPWMIPPEDPEYSSLNITTTSQSKNSNNAVITSSSSMNGQTNTTLQVKHIF